jgi:hypothetical protein
VSVLTRYRWFIVAGVVVLVGAAVAIIVWWPSPESAPPRARQYKDFDICLLTPQRGLADPDVAAVWAGAQEVSLQRSVRVLYLAVAGEQTPTRAAEYLASLVAQGCEVIVAVGPAPVAAVAVHEADYPQSTIVAVGVEIDDSSDARRKSSTMDVLTSLVPQL